MQFYLAYGFVFESLHQNQVQRTLVQRLHQFGESRFFPIIRVFGQQGPAPARGHHDLLRAGRTHAVTVLAGLIDIEVVVSVLDYGEAQAVGAQQGNKLFSRVVLPVPLAATKASSGGI